MSLNGPNPTRPSEECPRTPKPAVVAVLGASNVWLGLPDIVRHLVDRFGDTPLAMHVAHGPGRSYGGDAGVCGVRFPALSTCGVFDAFASEKRLDSPEFFALVTDVGNDIGYGADPEEIRAWVTRTVRRLRDIGVTVRVTSLPIASVSALPTWKFSILRRILFPFSPLTKELAIERMCAVQRALEAHEADHDTPMLRAERDWYRFDGIHIRRRDRLGVFGGWIDELLGVAGDRLDVHDVPPTRHAGRARVAVSPTSLRIRWPSVRRLARPGRTGPWSLTPTVTLEVH